MKLLAALILLSAIPDDLAARFGDWLSTNLGRPYVWGATGQKSYDCSGFVWRMLHDHGIMIKRTTARKLYMSTKPLAPGETLEFGTLVFFDDLKHVGIVHDKDTFFHAQFGTGTTHSPFAPYWRSKIVAYHKLPVAASE